MYTGTLIADLVSAVERAEKVAKEGRRTSSGSRTPPGVPLETISKEEEFLTVQTVPAGALSERG